MMMIVINLITIIEIDVIPGARDVQDVPETGRIDRDPQRPCRARAAWWPSRSLGIDREI